MALPVEGAAYSSLHRLVASALVATLLILAWRLWPELTATFRRESGIALALMSIAAVGVAAGYATVMLARTRVTTECIEQHGPFLRSIRLIDVTQARLINVPHLAWLITPRLKLHCGGSLASTTFYTADSGVLTALGAIELANARGCFARERALGKHEIRAERRFVA